MIASSFFFNDTATTEIYTLSLHDALPICRARAGAGRRSPKLSESGSERRHRRAGPAPARARRRVRPRPDAEGLGARLDRKSTRLNSSHSQISYAVFCLKKKKETITHSAN